MSRTGTDTTIMLLSLLSISDIIYVMLKTLERKFQDMSGPLTCLSQFSKNNHSFSMQKTFTTD
jgi:hypothetical protein